MRRITESFGFLEDGDFTVGYWGSSLIRFSVSVDASRMMNHYKPTRSRWRMSGCSSSWLNSVGLMKVWYVDAHSRFDLVLCIDYSIYSDF
ncbi:hypothetical protein BRADI_3g44255v3 [Brachypodium distachyon]|uniref:Uncharacterized protein n=1 Tax=Brachypodium distachyon TaxID=15368 RepID=A0A2K2D343_BRADI|nr:hypothetical protein BRADI_3g44255v3 [Brachypodium distachyon]